MLGAWLLFASAAAAPIVPSAVLVNARGRDDAASVVEQARAAIDACMRPRAVGTLQVRLQIRRDGSVGAVRRERGTLGSAPVEACMARALRALRFRESDRPTAIWLEWRLSTGNLDLPVDPHGHGMPAPSFSRRTEAPRVRVGMPEASGGYSPEVVRRVLRRNQNQIAFCYERTSGEHHFRAGQIRLRFQIETDGSVRTAQVLDDAIGSAELAACLTTILRRWTFPPPAGPIVVTYPLELGPPDRPGR
ncbi:MAG: AgmX/PglI C-terminal domain-containing protein [Sandaracinaceae bacterium]|nr:AgmX/PglI C-terminal domain-containing protein [Sandaracinaceae bacterium]